MKYQWAIFNVQENIGIVLLRPGPLHTPRVPIVVLVRIMHSMLGHFILVGMVVVSTMEEAERERERYCWKWMQSVRLAPYRLSPLRPPCCPPIMTFFTVLVELRVLSTVGALRVQVVGSLWVHGLTFGVPAMS